MPIKEIAWIGALSAGAGFAAVLVVYMLADGFPSVLIA